ncbi:MAG: ATP-binding cassette domain-containing protein [Candidatus Aegiribacteria sp.]|nr:ATP-binding cassette domain-containing protein [Candidatus Aegiribacteria sp.]
MKETIRLDGVTAGYRRGNPIIYDIDLTVPKSDFLAIIGPNGGGKTTLLKVILGLLTPWEGTVSVLGESPAKPRPAIGYVPQLIPDESFPITVIDVVLMGRLRNSGLFRRFTRRDREIADMNLDRLDIQDLAGLDMNSLSGGQKQRVLIARALAGNPQILLLDEPVASVDHNTQESFFNLLGELNSTITIVLVTHDVGAVSAHVKNIACINKTLISHGETLSSESVAKAYGCPFELISHGGIPHRVLGSGKESKR